MTDNRDTISGLYEAFKGHRYDDPGQSRLKQSTNTLIGVEFFDADSKKEATTGFKEIQNIPVEMETFREIITEHLKFFIVTTPIQPLDEIRFTEVQNLVPTGRTRLVRISTAVKGDGINGVMEGFYVISWI